ncbi:MAG: peptidoglycan bridge formation glycyltransferase FemA/FemB family protein [Anaerolineae bacterium]|uniref:lipid II:glycine glycyltransferase FemX n=1 Tax=Candidatus Amarolinea dominans TaxID=3140696 RepID=UPI0031367541|nr:peptidoglycan bridge formation glycyltransferase FemA/FemB family protein [Anaerolineae bacterium]
MQPLTYHAETDPRRWNDLLAGLPTHHLLQSWEWGEIKRQTGWWAHRLFFARQGAVVAAAQVLTRRLGRLPLAVQYVPKGPALDYADPVLTVQVLAALEDYARRSRAIFLKMDPDVPDDTLRGRAILDLLRHRGWQVAAEQVQFKNTALLDLTAGADAVQAGFKQKWRYNVRLAGRKGVTVRAGTEADLATFYRLYAETGGRDGFLIRPQTYYHDAWQTLLQSQGQVGGCLLLADSGAETVAGLFIARFARTAWYLYGASSSQQREAMPNHLLQWEAMRWALAQGCTTYDLWGAPTEMVESDPLWGVWRFKEGFGARFAPHIGAFDFAPSGLTYYLYTVAMPRVLSLMRRGHLV